MDIAVVLADPVAHERAFTQLLRDPPPAKLTAVARAAIKLGGRYLAAWGHAMRADLVRRVLAERIPLRPALRSPANTRDMVFLKEAVSSDDDDDQLLKRWRAATTALDQLATHRGAPTSQEEFVGAVRAAVVATDPTEETVVRPFLAVLARDGSEASVDALIPHVHHAWTTPGGLDRMHALRLFAGKTPFMDVLMAETEARLLQRSAGSPPVELLHDLGVDGDVCTFHIACKAERTLANMTLKLHSLAKPWLYASVESREGATSFTERALLCDGLHLGHAALAELPTFFAQGAAKLHVRWGWKDATITTTLSADAVATVMRWLRS